MRHISRTTAALAAVLAAGIVLSGCSAGADYSGASDGGSTAERAPLAVDAADTASDGEQNAAAADQALVITGTVTITADDPIAASEKATAIARAAGGRVDARTEYAPRDGDAGSATLTLRVPADAVEDVRDQLKELGTVEETDFSSVDVGTQQRDLDTRITTLRASIARYTSWLADADTTADLIQLEQAIAERQNELESLEAQQRALDDKVAMSTITLQLRSVALAPPPDGPDNFWEGLVVGWNGFVAFWGGVAVALGVGLPWLVVLGAVLTVVVLLVRRAGRSSVTPLTASAPAAATAPAAPSGSE
ncbi:DUF4349 domain-containing protein [Homoserinibacter gongjuensis]|uniref:DUF4349 domain-containing protein n=1 Tax=Homoserinibacter gongjuensis TaxID=1162968 RepID=UPI0024E063B8|nr:DUF4349 domain-containing protein [Homoserinibacter gongjuensis]